MTLGMKELMLSGAVISSLLSTVPANATGTTVSLLIASNVTAPIGALISDFAITYGGSYSVTYVSGSSGTLVNSITNAATAGTWDVFLSADNTRPGYLYNYTTTGHTTAPWLTAGIPFDYAVGTLVFWSADPANTVVPTDPPYASPLVIAQPGLAPYGHAADQFLTAVGQNYAFVNSTSYSNIDTTYNAIANSTFAQGFVALSQVCDASGSGAAYPASGSAQIIPEVEYSSLTATSGAKENVSINYDTIIQAGIKLANTWYAQSAPTHQSAVDAFITYLTSAGAKAVFKKYCYRTPA